MHTASRLPGVALWALVGLMLLVTLPALAGVDGSGKMVPAVTEAKGPAPDRGKPDPPARGRDRAHTTLDGRKVAATRLLARVRDADALRPASSLWAALDSEGITVERSSRVIPGLLRLRVAAAGASPVTGKSLRRRMKALRETGLFEYVEPDWLLRPLQVPTDSALADGTLWALDNFGQQSGTAGVDVNPEPAWAEVGGGSRDIVVGVVDSGIRYTHQDLAGNMWTNPGEVPGNGIDDDANGYVDDVFGIDAITGSGDPFDDDSHGTHVAGTIAATAFDAGPHVGVAYNVRLMALRFLPADGPGFTSDAVECIEYAIAQGADILNNSYGGSGFSQALEDAVEAANAAGILFVAAAGNESNNTDRTANFPSNFDVPNVVSVAAVDRRGQLAAFSNFGLETVDVGAPGVSIFSTVANSDASYGIFQGTSMASPHVAGVAALLASRMPSLSAAQLKDTLLASATPLAALNGRTVTGGMIDAGRAVTRTEDGELELNPVLREALTAGRPAVVGVRVSDLTPVTGATVRGSLDGAPLQTFVDDGVAPDEFVDDGIYTATLEVPADVATTTLSVEASAPGKTPASVTFDLQVVSRPVNDTFADRLILAAGTTQTEGSNREATLDPGEPLNPRVAGGRTVWWEWRAGTSGQATISTTGSDYDTTLAVYAGTDLSSLALLGANDDASGLQSAVTFDAQAGQIYQVQVDGYAGDTGNIRLNYPAPGGGPAGAPVILQQPTGGSLLEGEGFTLSVVAEGDAPLAYQWFFENAPIEGATAPEFTVASATVDDTGRYAVVVSNNVGNASSIQVSVFVDRIGVTPSNNDFDAAEVLSGTSGRVNGSNADTDGETGEPNHAGVSLPLESVWYRYEAEADGLLTVDTFGSDYDTTLAIYSGNAVTNLVQLDSNDDTGGLQSQVSARVSAGTTYQIAVDGFFSRDGQIVLSYELVPDDAGVANDLFVDAQTLALGPQVSGTNIGASGEPGEPIHARVSSPIASSWWTFVAPGDGQVRLTTDDSNFDTTIAAYQGGSVTALTELASDDDGGPGLTSQITIPVRAAQRYMVAVDGYARSEGIVRLAGTFITAEEVDSDGDGVPDSLDNCIANANPDQADFDGDGSGDLCDADDDNDGVSDGFDDFPFDPGETNDNDGDGIGDNADDDDDNDGVSDANDPAPNDATVPNGGGGNGGGGGGGAVDVTMILGLLLLALWRAHGAGSALTRSGAARRLRTAGARRPRCSGGVAAIPWVGGGPVSGEHS